ncbi:MAG TPA: hypothetical protein VNM90_10340 [Haliangium sp.]|nr:hypothetical protein [Haliangium sp.]
MSSHSFGQTLRRRIAPLAFLLALALLGSRTCAREMTRVEIRLDLGASAAHVETLRVDVFPADADTGVASFERHLRGQPPPNPLAFEAALDPGTYRLRVDARWRAGSSARTPGRTLERVIVVGEQPGERTVISVDLEQALLASGPGAD